MGATQTKSGYSVEQSKDILAKMLKYARHNEDYKGSDDPKEFIDWAEKNNKSYKAKNGAVIDLKRLTFTETGENEGVISWEPDDVPDPETQNMDGEDLEDDDDDKPKEGAKSFADVNDEIGRLRAQVKNLKAIVQRGGFASNPGNGGAAPIVTSVKTGAERYYHERAKSGKAFFSDIDHCVMFGHILSGIIHRGKGQLDKAHDQHKALLTLMERKRYDDKAYATAPLSSGGALVPEELSPDLLRQLNDFGIARQICKVYTLTSGEFKRPRADGYLTGYYPEEGTDGTESQTEFSLDLMKPKMVFVLASFSRQILDDANLDLIDDVAGEMMRAIARIEDNTLINGTGVHSTALQYIPSVQGILPKLGTTAASDSRSHTGGGTADAHDATDLFLTMAKVPQWARNERTIWLASPEMASAVLYRIAHTTGGMTSKEFAGKTVNAIAGYPVVEINTMPTAIDGGGNDQVDVIFGDFAGAAMLGDRMGVEIETSDQVDWRSGKIAIRAIARHDINVHSVGATNQQGPLGILWQT